MLVAEAFLLVFTQMSRSNSSPESPLKRNTEVVSKLAHQYAAQGRPCVPACCGCLSPELHGQR